MHAAFLILVTAKPGRCGDSPAEIVAGRRSAAAELPCCLVASLPRGYRNIAKPMCITLAMLATLPWRYAQVSFYRSCLATLTILATFSSTIRPTFL
jgi:hypothetical protein